MRIDLFLKLSRLIKQREAAKQSCERGLVRVDGRPVKPSREVRVGDRILLDLLDQHLEVEVLELPSGNVSKARSHTLYRVIS
ncbi:MAG: RNA-binding S4 domain-containing protein [Candidatus Latescibacteria bacterium]|nr:RNA-binding S4 domain-containing protein [Candidatus Latescibacterota bacterium]